MDMAGHDADLDLIRRDDAGAVRTDEERAFALHAVLRNDHVAHRDTLGDADHDIQVRFHRLLDRRGGERRRHIDHGDVSARLRLGVFDGAEDRNALEILARLLWIHPGYETRLSVGIRPARLRVELAGLSGDALRHHPGVPVDEDAHRFFAALPFTAATTFCAASAMLSAEMISRPESRRIFLPRSSFVPFMRTTRGMESLTSRAAATTPVAMVSHFMMPPKMLTRIALTFLFDSMILKAAVTRSAVALPPTSRKFAGAPPNSLIVSMVAMARPAPFTMQAMLPSSEM